MSSDVEPYTSINPNTNGNFNAGFKWYQEGYEDDQSSLNSIQNTGLASNQFEIASVQYSADLVGRYESPFGDTKFLKDISTNVREVYTDNTWYEIDFRYSLNTVGEKDGIIQVWVNGTLVQDEQGYDWRGTSSNGFKRLSILFYPDGVEDTWEESTVRYIGLRDIQLSTDSLITTKTTLESVPGFIVDCTDNGVNSIRLDWQIVDSDATNIVIERSQDTTAWTQIASISSALVTYTDATLNSNEVYYYRIKLTDGTVTYADSPYSNVVSCTTATNPALVLAPTNLSVNCDDFASSTISWNYADHSKDIEIVIEQSSDGIIFSEIDTVEASHQLDEYYAIGLSASTQYWWRIFARDKNTTNTSLTVGPVTCTTPAASTPPSAPCKLQYRFGGGSWIDILVSGQITLTGVSETNANNLQFRYDCVTPCFKTYELVDWAEPIANDFYVNVTGANIVVDVSDYHNLTKTIVMDPDATKQVTIISDVVHGSTSVAVNEITYTPDPDFNGIDSLTYTYQNGLSETCVNIGKIYFNVTSVNQGTSVMTIDDSSSNLININVANSHYGDMVPTGSGSGYHNFIFILENDDDRPSVEFTKQPGDTWSTSDANALAAIGLTGLTGTFNGSISALAKNSSNVDELAYDISVHHRYGISATGYFANVSIGKISKYGILAWDDESDPVTLAVGPTFLDTRLAGGISFVSNPLTSIYNVDRYSIQNVTSGTWRVIEYNLPCIAHSTGLTDNLTVNGTTTLRTAIQNYVASKVNTSFTYNSVDYIDTVHHYGNLSRSQVWVRNCDNFIDNYYIIVEDSGTGDYFKIDMTINEINQK